MPIRPQCFKALTDLRDEGSLDPSSAYVVLDRFYPDATDLDAWWAPDGSSVTVQVDTVASIDKETLVPAPPAVPAEDPALPEEAR
jgi:hypothetical protein